MGWFRCSFRVREVRGYSLWLFPLTFSASLLLYLGVFYVLSENVISLFPCFSLLKSFFLLLPGNVFIIRCHCAKCLQCLTISPIQLSYTLVAAEQINGGGGRGWGQHTSRNPQPPPECQGSGQSRAEARTCPEVPQGSNKGGRGGRAFLTFPTFPAGRGWMEKPSLNVPSVPFRRRFLSFTQTLSLHRKQKGLFNMPTQMS